MKNLSQRGESAGPQNFDPAPFLGTIVLKSLSEVFSYRDAYSCSALSVVLNKSRNLIHRPVELHREFYQGDIVPTIHNFSDSLIS